MRSCYCLNILIYSNQDDFLKVNLDTLNLNEEEKSHPFFKHGIRLVEKLIEISTNHVGLVETKNVGSWSINRCINCDCFSHAVHNEKGASNILINPSLLNSEDVQSLRSSKIYSKVYKIVVNPNDIGFEDDVEYIELDAEARKNRLNYENVEAYCQKMPGEISKAINKIRDIKRDILANEDVKVAERIAKYKEEQQSQFNKLKEKAREEEESLIRLILCTNDPSFHKKMNMAGPPWSSESLGDQTLTGSPVPDAETLENTRYSPKRQKSSKIHANSFDTETLFDLDIDEDQRSDGTSIEDVEEIHVNDNNIEDGREESGISIPKRRQPKLVVAKSLPMTIPKIRYRSTEDLDDDEILDDNVDIAASIKALARSVHGDAVFGELPRPRFSTQI